MNLEASLYKVVNSEENELLRHWNLYQPLILDQNKIENSKMEILNLLCSKLQFFLDVGVTQLFYLKSTCLTQWLGP